MALFFRFHGLWKNISWSPKISPRTRILNFGDPLEPAWWLEEHWYLSLISNWEIRFPRSSSQTWRTLWFFFFQLSQIVTCGSVDSCIQIVISPGEDLWLMLIMSTIPFTRSVTGLVVTFSPLGTRRVYYTTNQSFLILKWWWQYMSPESGPVSLDLGTCAEPLRKKRKRHLPLCWDYWQ